MQFAREQHRFLGKIKKKLIHFSSEISPDFIEIGLYN